MPSTAPRTPKLSGMIQLALFGAGRWAQAAHLASLAGMENVRIAVIASSDGASAQPLATELRAVAMSADDLVVKLAAWARHKQPSAETALGAEGSGAQAHQADPGTSPSVGKASPESQPGAASQASEPSIFDPALDLAPDDPAREIKLTPDGDPAIEPEWHLDGVIIATPPHTHAALAAAAIAAGLPVLCELPLAMDPVAARELAKAAHTANVLNGTTLPRPLLYGGERVRELLGELGDLQRATLTVRLPDTPMAMLFGLGASALTALFGEAELPLIKRTQPGAHADAAALTGGPTVRFRAHPHLEVVVDLKAQAATGFTCLDVEGTRGILRWNWAQPGAIHIDAKDDDPDAGPRDESVTPEHNLAKAFPFTRRFVEALIARRTDASTAIKPDFSDGAATIELAAALAQALRT